MADSFKPDSFVADSKDSFTPDAPHPSSIQAPSEYAFAKGLPPQDNALPNVVGDPVGRLKTTARVGAGIGLGMAAAPMMEGAGLLSQMATQGGAAGLQKYFSNLVDQKQDPTEGVVGNTALGALTQGGLGVASKGATKLADWLQQAASGMTKYRPGVGNNLVDQGIWGTKNSMANQVAEALPAKEQEVQDAVSSISGNSDVQPISDAISSLKGKFLQPSTGEAAPRMAGYAQKVSDAADEFSSMGEGGEATPQDLLSFKRQGDYDAYTNSGNKATSLEAEIGQAQADKAREMLSSLSDGETARKLADEQALILAKKSLTKPDSIPGGFGAKAFFMKLPGQSLFGSGSAQALQKGAAGGANALSDPRVIQSLFGLSNANSSGQ